MSTETTRVDVSPAWRRWLPRVLRIVIALAVVIGIGRRLWLERDRLASFERDIHWVWLVLAGLAYIAGLSSCAVYWWWSMRDQGYRPSLLSTWVAYLAGHLGKYVPGKGLVVVIRAGLMRDWNVPWPVGAVSCAHETLVMMATGGLVAAAIIPVLNLPHANYLFLSSLLLVAVLGVSALPPLVSRWGRWMTRPFAKAGVETTYTARWSTVAGGAALIACGWIMMGISLAAVLASLESWTVLVDRMGFCWSVALATAVVALATAGGFVSLLPGGLGSREWIMVEMLGQALGPGGIADAAVVAFVLRIAWVVAELVGTGVFYLLDRQCNKRRAAAG